MQKISFVSMVAGHMSEHTPLVKSQMETMELLRLSLPHPNNYRLKARGLGWGTCMPQTYSTYDCIKQISMSK